MNNKYEIGDIISHNGQTYARVLTYNMDINNSYYELEKIDHSYRKCDIDFIITRIEMSLLEDFTELDVRYQREQKLKRILKK